MTYKFELPELPYAYDAIEPTIDQATMEIHHTKHHNAYVTNLNNALTAHEDLQNKTLDELISDLDALPAEIQTAVRNNGGGHKNHSLFWEVIQAPQENNDENVPAALKEKIAADLGSFADFKQAFEQAAATRFGSGWAFLVLNADNKFEVMSMPNQDNPVMEGQQAVLGLDVWEHAYYLNYQNRRPEYISAFWSIVNWDKVAENAGL